MAAQPQPEWVQLAVRAIQAALRCSYPLQQVAAIGEVLIDSTPVAKMLAALKLVPTCPAGCWHQRCQKVREAIESAERL
jgi:hypothetical protein